MGLRTDSCGPRPTDGSRGAGDPKGPSRSEGWLSSDLLQSVHKAEAIGERLATGFHALRRVLQQKLEPRLCPVSLGSSLAFRSNHRAAPPSPSASGLATTCEGREQSWVISGVFCPCRVSALATGRSPGSLPAAEILVAHLLQKRLRKKK